MSTASFALHLQYPNSSKFMIDLLVVFFSAGRFLPIIFDETLKANE